MLRVAKSSHPRGPCHGLEKQEHSLSCLHQLSTNFLFSSVFDSTQLLESFTEIAHVTFWPIYRIYLDFLPPFASLVLVDNPGLE